MTFLQRLSRYIASTTSDDSFLKVLKGVETLVSKLLSIAMVVVLLVLVVDLGVFLVQDLFLERNGFLSATVIEIFGLFLNVLVALEILENITAYLKKHVIQVELVIATSLTAIARKIIIFDFDKADSIDLIGLALATVALSIGYWLVHHSNRRQKDS